MHAPIFIAFVFCTVLSFFRGNAAQPNQEKYFLSVSSLFKDEAPYLKEWIEYHKLVGVDHFYLYDNGSTDNFREVLDPYLKKGEVTLIDWPNRNTETWGKNNSNWVLTTQGPAFEHACRTVALNETKWLAMIDIDEFLVPATANSMRDILCKYADAPGIMLLWQIFGTSYVPSLPPNKLLIEVLHLTSATTTPYNSPPKSIVNPPMFESFSWPPHACKYKGGLQPVQLDKSEAQLNHYVNRTHDYFIGQKVRKKVLMENKKLSSCEIREMEARGNEVEDTHRYIHRFVPQLRRKMGFDK